MDIWHIVLIGLKRPEDGRVRKCLVHDDNDVGRGIRDCRTVIRIRLKDLADGCSAVIIRLVHRDIL